MRSIIVDQMKMNDIGGAYDTTGGGGGESRGGLVGKKRRG